MIASGKARLLAREQQPHVWDVLETRPLANLENVGSTQQSDAIASRTCSTLMTIQAFRVTRRGGYWPVSTPPKQLVAHFEFEDGPFRVVGTVLIPNPLS